MKWFGAITIVLSVAAGPLSFGVLNPASAESPMQLTVGENAISISAGRQVLLHYRYRNVPFKPYVRQLFSPGGVNVLLDAPADHLHHHGLMLAVTVDGVNFWTEHQSAGHQAHRSLAHTSVDDYEEMPRASFTQHIDWLNLHPQRLLLKETRRIEICRVKDLEVTLLTWQSRFELPPGKKSATVTGAHYHGLGMRFLKSMDAVGQFRNADQKIGEIVRGDERLVQSTWCAYSANTNGRTITVAMFDHPGNPRRPATWFTMAKPFAYLSATLNLHREPLKVTADNPLVLTYAVALWDSHVEADRINRLYQGWRSRPAFVTARVNTKRRNESGNY